LSFRGRVEVGFAPGEKEEIQALLATHRCRSSSFTDRRRTDDVYAEPSLLAEIRYLEVTSSGVLRHAAFRQLGGRWR
jgi:ATP-dependent DNA ligase